jgi:hypothetical protein
MAQHAAPATHRRRRSGGGELSTTPESVVLPFGAGVAYGLWAASIQRYGGEVTGGNIALGFITGAIVAVLCFGIHRWSKAQAGRHFLTRALMWAVFAGVAIGFLHSLGNGTVLWSATLGVITAIGVFLGTFYRYYSSNEYA